MKLWGWLVTLVTLPVAAPFAHAGDAPGKKRPNIIWITCEDMGPHIGPYGDKYATTPNLDALAKKSLRYLTAWSNAPVCAPARTALISGMYPSSTGSEHMRSMTKLPDMMRLFVAYLRMHGYYCTNRVKEDYNLAKIGPVWDDSSTKAHHQNRKAGQPFFAVYNFTITHESQIRTRPHKLVHDPAKVRIPAYHPDTPEVRHDWAQYYDNITAMDKQVGAILRELEEAGLAEDTIIIFFSDHGSGMPRNKRCVNNSGLHVPLLVHFPEKLRPLAPKDYTPGGTTPRLVSFVDFGPSMISLAGVQPPVHMQGEAFLGPHAAPPRQYLHGLRGRMDERLDLVRSVRDKRFVYVRNYMPHKAQGQFLNYMFQTPTTRVWHQLFQQGKLNDAQSFFWKPRPGEELYDLENDPDEVRNLAGMPEHQETLKRLRKARHEHVLKIRDVGFLPEDEMHARAAASTPYEMGHDDATYPLKKVLAAADLASMLRADDLPQLVRLLDDADSAVRYWAVVGHTMRGKEAVAASGKELTKALTDKAPCVRIAAAEALGRYGANEDAENAAAALAELIPFKKNGVFVSVQALNALLEMGPRGASAHAALKDAALGIEAAPPRTREYIPRLVEKIRADAK